MLWKRSDAEPHFITDSNARDVALVDAELELQGVGATDDGEHVTSLGARPHSFLGPRSEHDPLNRRANDARLNLFVEHFDFAAQNIGTKTLEAFFRGVSARRANRRCAFRRRDGGQRGVALSTKRVVSQVRNRRSAIDNRAFVNEHAIDDAGQRGPNVCTRHGPKHGIRTGNAERPANERERGDRDQ